MQLTKQEQDFLEYWETNRSNKKKFLRQFSIGLPLGVLMVLAIFINLFSGWNKRAEMVARGNSSFLYTVVIAVVAIAVFITVFSSRHKWEQNEQKYQELRQKQKKAEAAHSPNNAS
jgi:sterol desaturase/sphingolipid hydroxylase (fatty acid hydroxylase superfamily)